MKEENDGSETTQQIITFVTQKRPTNFVLPTVTKKPKIEEKKQNIEKENEVEDFKEYWIKPGLIVKILNKTIAYGQFFGKKRYYNRSN